MIDKINFTRINKLRVHIHSLVFVIQITILITKKGHEGYYIFIPLESLSFALQCNAVIDNFF